MEASASLILFAGKPRCDVYSLNDEQPEGWTPTAAVSSLSGGIGCFFRKRRGDLIHTRSPPCCLQLELGIIPARCSPMAREAVAPGDGAGNRLCSC